MVPSRTSRFILIFFWRGGLNLNREGNLSWGLMVYVQISKIRGVWGKIKPRHPKIWGFVRSK